MGDYTFFIVGSYAITALVVGGLIVRAVIDHRAQVNALAELESRGMRRRSSARTAAAEPLATRQVAQ